VTYWGCPRTALPMVTSRWAGWSCPVGAEPQVGRTSRDSAGLPPRPTRVGIVI